MARHEPSALLEGVRFESVPRDRNRAVIVTKWTGIDEGAAMRRDQLPRPGAHGAYAVPGHLDARVIGMSGHVIDRSPKMLLRTARRLTGLLAGGEFAQLIVMGEREVHMRVGLSAQTSVVVRGNDPCVADFQLQLWAPNPRMYGEVREFAAGQYAYHYGNFPALPELIITGPAPSGYTITGTGGRRYVVTQPLSAGQTHRIDMATGWLYRDGVLQSGAVQQAHTWEVPPGLPGVVHKIVGAVGSFTVRLTDTFV